MTDPEREPLVSQAPVEQRSRRWRVGCLMAVVFLQFLSTNAIDSYLRGDFYKFDIDMKNMSAGLVVGAVIIYILPVCIGLYADVIVGKYTALFFGLCLKVLGAFILLFVPLRFEVWPTDVDPITLKVLAAVFGASVVMIAVGFCMIIPSLLSLGSQQVNQQTGSQASFIRWFFMAAIAGSIIEYFLTHYDIYMPYDRPWLTNHTLSVQHGARLTLDVLSLVIFLCGKPFYIKPSTAEGRKSIQRFMQFARKHITCLSSRRHYDAIDKAQHMRDVHDISNNRTLERHRIRKAVITIPLFSAVAASFVVLVGLDHVTVTNAEFYPTGTKMLNLVRNMRFAIFLPIVPLMELIIRKCGHQLWQNDLANQLKALGLGMLLIAIACLTAGVVASILPHRDYVGVSVLYVLPQYALLGLASILQGISGMTICLSESPTGLSTFVIGLIISLCLLLIPLLVLVGTSMDLNNMIPYTDVVCYVMAGVLLAILVFIYVPVSIQYVKHSRAIVIALEEQENSETHNNARSVNPVTE